MEFDHCFTKTLKFAAIMSRELITLHILCGLAAFDRCSSQRGLFPSAELH